MNETEAHLILVVDDNDDVRRLVKKVLEKAGHQVLEATDGEAALRVLDETVPELVLMDVRLPGRLDGLQTTEQMREDPRLSRVPVVALTASVLEQDRRLALEAGCSGFIGKPIDIAVLPELVLKFVGMRGRNPAKRE